MLIKELQKIFVLIIICLLLTGLKIACGQTPAFQIEFVNTNNGNALLLDTAIYKNSLGQTYSVSRFRYYINDIQLISADGTQQAVSGYYLIDEEVAASKIITVAATETGSFTSIKFMLGVDSLHNCSGIQSGALDPAKGMFWAWNTGYIFLKLEGKSPSSQLTGNLIEYHVRGYREPHNAIRNIHLNLPQTITLKPGKTQRIKIIADVNAVLSEPVAINFKEIPSVTDFKNAVMMADNYRDMFSIQP
jgi:hypothetical protein